MNYEQSNVGPGMVPCKKNCRCNDCTIERLQARARIAEQRDMDHKDTIKRLTDEKAELVKVLKKIGYATLTGQEAGRVARNVLAKHE